MPLIFRDLPVPLTSEEYNARSAALAQALRERELLVEELADARAKFKARAETLDAKISDLGDKVRSRREIRAVECLERSDDRRFVVEIFRGDTGELVESRPMSALERNRATNPLLPGVVEEHTVTIRVDGPIVGEDPDRITRELVETITVRPDDPVAGTPEFFEEFDRRLEVRRAEARAARSAAAAVSDPVKMHPVIGPGLVDDPWDEPAPAEPKTKRKKRGDANGSNP